MVEIQQHDFFRVRVKELADFAQTRLHLVTQQSVREVEFLGALLGDGDAKVEVADAGLELLREAEALRHRPSLHEAFPQIRQFAGVPNGSRAIRPEIVGGLHRAGERVVRPCEGKGQHVLYTTLGVTWCVTISWLPTHAAIVVVTPERCAPIEGSGTNLKQVACEMCKFCACECRSNILESRVLLGIHLGCFDLISNFDPGFLFWGGGRGGGRHQCQN